MTPILILAAGRSSRMRGADKLLEMVDGLPLLRRQVNAALSTGEPVFVALPSLTHPRAKAIANLGVTLIEVPTADQGMSESLKTGVRALPASAWFMVLLADLVGLTSDDLKQMLDYNPGSDTLILRGADQSGAQGHPILFETSLRAAFETLSGDSGGAEIIRAHKARMELVTLPSDHATLDLDTPEDWAAFRSIPRT